MLFNSLEFLIFFPLVTILYFLIRHERRWFLLLVASCYFYMAFVPVYILILFFTIVIDYYAGILIESSAGKRRKLMLVLSLVSNIGVLAVFKYYNFLNDNLSHVLGLLHYSNPLPALKMLLPIGLSFHTFQAMSYTIEVYRGHQKAERHFGIYSLYVMFYPQLVAGPIERPQNLLHQFREHHHFDADNFRAGIMQMAFGMFKKVVIADRLAIAVDFAYNNYESQSGLSLAIAAVLYSFQIYCDFSGYSEIALGAARVMGFRLMVNFNAPYLAQSVTEFWRRWHISLSTWFKDYLYISLGGNRKGRLRLYMNLFIVFMVSGLWHGPNWTFVVWGAMHGIFIIIERLLHIDTTGNEQDQSGTALRSVRTVFTFCLVTLAWIFFRAENLQKAVSIVSQIAHLSFSDSVHLGLNAAELIFSFLLIALLYWVEKRSVDFKFRHRWSFVLALLAFVFICCFFGVFDSKQFIYFQF